MIEVELKTRVDDLEKVKKELSKKDFETVGKAKHVDRIFIHPDQSDHEKKIIEGGIVARIRGIDDKHVLEFKEISREKNSGIELKHEISDVNAVILFLNKLGFEESFSIIKQREKYRSGELSICLDDVEKLGLFLEVEIIVSSSDKKEKALEKCSRILDELIPGSKIEKDKYGDMMLDLMKKEGK